MDEIPVKHLKDMAIIDVHRLNYDGITAEAITRIYADVEWHYPGYCGFLQGPQNFKYSMYAVCPPSQVTRYLMLIDKRVRNDFLITQHIRTTIQSHINQTYGNSDITG